MKLKEAERIARELVEELKPFSLQIEVAGSIRRKRPEVHDIDIVMVPDFHYLNRSHGLGYDMRKVIPEIADQVHLNGPKLARFSYHGADVDLYYARPETFTTLLLIRTGSKDNNIHLCAAAKRRGWKLRANGEGLFDERGRRIAGSSEEEIYRLLRLPYQPPQKRDPYEFFRLASSARQNMELTEPPQELHAQIVRIISRLPTEEG